MKAQEEAEAEFKKAKAAEKAAAEAKAKAEADDEEEDQYKDLTPEQRIIQTKEDIATLAEKLIEDPEENIMLLSRLRRMAQSKNPITSKLALLSLVPVFKSISPMYKIRALTDTEKREKVTKEVGRLRFFEENLVLNYKNYIDFLSSKTKFFMNTPKATELDKELGLLATGAACELAGSLKFFNFRSDLFQILVRRIMRKPSSDAEFEKFQQCVTVLESELLEDNDGDLSLDVVRQLNKSMKKREFKVDEAVVNVLLSLQILSDYDPYGGAEEGEKPKLKKKDRVHLSKKERKQLKERKQIEAEMRVAEQAISAEERERNQAQILKLLLMLYLEILKSRPEQLMAPVLEGLAKFGHLVNVDLMGDFLQVLREIAEDLIETTSTTTTITSNQLRQIMLCVVTSFSLVDNIPSKKVKLDLKKFVDYLYSILPILSQDTEIEFSHKTLRLMDPLSNKFVKPNVNISTKSELLLRSLVSIFFQSNSNSSMRALAFTKRLYSNLLQFPEKTSIATLKFIDKLNSRYEDDLKSLYTTEDRVANGVYQPQVDDLERSNAQVAVLWENVLLEKHYCPAVAMGAKSLMKKAK
ncbi:unnamed protein product [Ambrosiozyma monospora]|uniref:Unnamed protein product n=1 Tax=Ambrosiozyma monospora TaxID=43982 RepID=A0ACB5T530_AMBMO|nr:unnamed protein product [Ambrosiozyma monospora]